jgi:hypothetical protein
MEWFFWCSGSVKSLKKTLFFHFQNLRSKNSKKNKPYDGRKEKPETQIRFFAGRNFLATKVKEGK